MNVIKKVAVITNLPKPSQDSYKERMQRYFKTNDRIKEFKEGTGKIHTLGWNSDGKKIAIGTRDKVLTISSFERDRLVRN